MAEQTQKTNILGTEPIGRLMAKFAVPSVISLLVNALYNIVDQIFIGKGVGYLGNGATNVIFPVTVIACAFAFMIGDGGAAFLSLKLGEKDKASGQKGINNAITMLTVISIIFLAVGLVFLKPIALMFGATEKILPYALDYGYIIVLGLPFVIVSTGLNSFIRADGSPKIAMVSMLIGAIANTVLDPLFIFVFGWGVKGAAFATIIGQILTFIVSVIYIPFFRNIKIKLKDMKPDFRICKTVSSFGISSFITQISITIAMFALNNTLVKYGGMSQYGQEIPLTALGIVMKVNQILISIIVGIAIGSQPIIGYNYGARNFKRVKKTFLTAITISTAVTIAGFILFQFFPQTIINLFGSEEGLYNEFAQKCFRTFLFVCFLNGFQITSGIFFQAIGKPLKAMLITLSRQILALVPAVLILPLFFGVDGILYAGPTADSIAFVMALILVIFEMRILTKKEPELVPSTVTYLTAEAETTACERNDVSDYEEASKQYELQLKNEDLSNEQSECEIETGQTEDQSQEKEDPGVINTKSVKDE